MCDVLVQLLKGRSVLEILDHQSYFATLYRKYFAKKIVRGKRYILSGINDSVIVSISDRYQS